MWTIRVLLLATIVISSNQSKCDCEKKLCPLILCAADSIYVSPDPTQCRCCEECRLSKCNCDRIQCDPPVCEDGTELVTMDKNDAPTCLCCPFCASTENKCANVTCIAADKITCPLTTKLENPDLENGRCCASCA